MVKISSFLYRRAVKKVFFGQSLKPKSLAKGFLMASFLSWIGKHSK